jgi:hypothetical protein
LVDCVTIEPGTLFFRNLMCDEFDVFEMSISEMLLAIESPDVGRWDSSALPVYFLGDTLTRSLLVKL